MESKDNRSKQKRNNMRQHPRKVAQTYAERNKTFSSAVIDVADSSDEIVRSSWVTRSGQQRNLDLLNEEPDLNDLNEDDVGSAQMNAGDFNIMSQMPTSVGGHFQFASEKNWETAEGKQLLENTEAREYFTLNLKLLNVGLQTIPFYKRMDYSASMFTQKQLHSMETAADIAEKSFQNVLKEHESHPRIKINSGSRKSGSAKSQATVKEAPSSVDANNQQDELDELLDLTTEQVATVDLDAGEQSTVATAGATTENANAVAVGGGTKDDIQQWLDNVLEE